jgi:hypothetical protein
MSTALAPRGLGIAEWGKTEARRNLATAFPSVLYLEEPSPESQKTRLAILIADGAPISGGPAFSRRRSAAAPQVDDQIDLRFTPIRPTRFSMRTRVKSRGRIGTPKPRKKTATYCQPLPLFARWEHSLKRLKSQHGLGLQLCKPRPLPCTTGIALVPGRTQHRLAGAEPGGTWLSRLCSTAQAEGPRVHLTAALPGLTKVSLEPMSRIAASAKSLFRQKLLQFTTVASSREPIPSRGIRLPRLCV